MTTFLGELSEHVRVLNEGLLALEKDPDGPGRAEWFKTLYRAAHSLKGAARSVSVPLIEETCHRLEEVLSAARDRKIPLTPDLYGLLFATADAIEEAGMRLREQHDLSDSPLTGLLPRLEAASTSGPALNSPSPPPAPPPEPTPALRPEPTPARAPAAPPPRAEDPGPVAAPEPAPAAPPASALAAPRPPSPAPSDYSKPQAGAAFVRVPAEKLDALLTRNGELLVARRRVQERAAKLIDLRDAVGRWGEEWRAASKPLGALLRDGRRAGDLLPARALQAVAAVGDRLAGLEKELEQFAVLQAADHRHLARVAGALDEEVRRVRMLPFSDACVGLDRAVRDVAREEGKLVALVVEGGDVELDRSVLEGLKDPLTHLVRNAIDHGVEPPDQRRQAGKEETARVTVTARLRGAQVEVAVADDGAGIDLEAVRRQARQRGFAEPADDRDLIDLIFLPGFSTSALITNISGRGVGLDVVKNNVEALHGTIGVASEPGRGVRFTLSVPLTLTTLRVLLLKAGGQHFALASANVETLVRIGPDDVRTVEGREVLAQGGPPLPLAVLAEVLGLPARAPEAAGAKRPGVRLSAGDRRMAFVVDELLAEQEVIVKNLGGRVRRVRHFSGATILPDGKIALVLNPVNLIRAAQGRCAGAAPPRRPAEASAVARKRLLIVDDSVTTRTLEKSILEAAGYEVATAVDGEAGWRLLQERGADLLITDIEMPRMDGFALTDAVKSSPRFADLPVILFSSRASERDKARGIEVGADAYIVKSEFDQTDLLETVAQLL